MPDALDAAWKIHAAQVDWTGKVDAKASFAFTIDSAALGVVLALSTAGRTFSTRDGFIEGLLYWAGLALLLAGAFVALMVVRPRLRSHVALRESATNYVYFGHAKEWTGDKLASELTDGDILPVLTRQIVQMARIAWIKHRRVQLAMTLGSLGMGLLTTAALMIAV